MAAEMNEQDQEEMQRLQAGQETALNTLIHRHGEKLFHYLLRQLGNETDAADLAQETFVRVYQNRARFDVRQKFSTWLYAIATNLLRDRFRWQKRHPQIPLDATTDEGASLGDCLADKGVLPDQQLAASERVDQVREAIACLPEDLRTALILSEYEDLSHIEIGSILNCTPKAVETRLYRARAHLKKRLANFL